MRSAAIIFVCLFLLALGAVANAQRGGRGFSSMDKDVDGKVSYEEFRQRTDDRFRNLDKNGDGYITSEERPQRGGGHRRGGSQPQNIQ